MKYAIIFLPFFIFSCTSTNSDKQSCKKNIDTLSISLTTKYDSIITHTCTNANLSNQFDIKTNLIRYRDTIELQDSSIVRLYIMEKITQKVLDSLVVKCGYLYENEFMDCDQFSSFTTSKKPPEIVENNAGNIVVADFNFDKKDDIAVMYNSGGNGGPFYYYFMQTNNKKWEILQDLTLAIFLAK